MATRADAPTAPPTRERPAPAAGATPEAPASTVVTVGGNQFDLHNISVERGNALAVALIAANPANEARITSLARFVREHEATLNLEIPPELSLSGAWQMYTRALRDGGGQLGSTAESWMRQMDSLVGDDVRASMQDFLRGPQAAAANIQLVGNITDAALDTITLGPLRRLPGVASSLWSEGSAALGGGASEEQARAFAAAYIAATEEARRRAESNEQTLGDQAASGWDHAMSWMQSIFTSGSIFFQTAWRFVCEGFAGRGWDWSAADQHVRTTLPEDIRNITDFGELQQHYLQRNTTRREEENARTPARDIMINADTVAGMDTGPIVSLITQGGLRQRQDGTRALVRWNDGSLQEEVLRNPETNAPITALDRASGSLATLAPGGGDGNSDLTGSVVGGGLGGWALHAGLRRMGVERPIMGTLSRAGGVVRSATVGSVLGTAAEGTRGLNNLTSRFASGDLSRAISGTTEVTGDTVRAVGQADNLFSAGARFLGGVVRGGGKLIRGIPLVGGLITQGEYHLWGTTTTTDGRTMRYMEALDHDLQIGAIDQETHDRMRALQLGDMATSFGGLITLGATETARATFLNSDECRRYLPPSLIQTLSSAVGLGNDDGRLHDAARDATVRAQTAARGAVPSRTNVILSETNSEPSAPAFGGTGGLRLAVV